MSKATAEPKWRCDLFFVIQFFQLLSFQMPANLTYNASIYSTFGWWHYTDWLSYFSAGVQLFPYFKLSSVAMICGFVASVLLVFFNIVLAVYVASQFDLESFKSMKSLRYLILYSGFKYILKLF